MAHDFNLMAQTLGFPGEKEMFETLYKNMSLAELSTALHISTALCRKKLHQHSIPMRGRGGPNGLKLVMTQEIVDEMKALGAAAVAKKYGVAKYTLFKQKARFLAQNSPASASTEPGQSPDSPPAGPETTAVTEG